MFLKLEHWTNWVMAFSHGHVVGMQPWNNSLIFSMAFNFQVSCPNQQNNAHCALRNEHHNPWCASNHIALSLDFITCKKD